MGTFTRLYAVPDMYKEDALPPYLTAFKSQHLLMKQVLGWHTSVVGPVLAAPAPSVPVQVWWLLRVGTAACWLQAKAWCISTPCVLDGPGPCVRWQPLGVSPVALL
jgi:hypothetical protein